MINSGFYVDNNHLNHSHNINNSNNSKVNTTSLNIISGHNKGGVGVGHIPNAPSITNLLGGCSGSNNMLLHSVNAVSARTKRRKSHNITAAAAAASATLITSNNSGTSSNNNNNNNLIMPSSLGGSNNSSNIVHHVSGGGGGVGVGNVMTNLNTAAASHNA